MTPKAATLAKDYRCPAVPNSARDVYRGHVAGVKCVAYVGERGFLLASGDGDGEIKIWPTNPAAFNTHSDGDDDAAPVDGGKTTLEEALRRRRMEGVHDVTLEARRGQDCCQQQQDVAPLMTLRAASGKEKVKHFRRSCSGVSFSKACIHFSNA